MSEGRTVRLFLVEGSPTGLLAAEIMNWTGHVLVTPRSKLPDALKRTECSRTGVYLLMGDDPSHPSKMRIYIGEADSVAERLKAHSKDIAKDFWTHAYIVTSKDQNLTKAHVRYLESRLVELAKSAGRASVANGNDPAPKLLPESDIADMEFFIRQLEIVLPVLNVDVFRPKKGPEKPDGQVPTNSTSGTPLKLVNVQNGVNASAVEFDGEVVVLAGSKGTGKSFATNNYASLREALIQDGSIQTVADGSIKFVQDVVFPSPSAAAAVLLNRNSNGRTEWRVGETSQTLKDWQDLNLSAISNASPAYTST